MIIRLDDIKNAGKGYCRKGIMKFFKDHDLDFADFLTNGIDDQIIKDLDDAMANILLKEIENGRK